MWIVRLALNRPYTFIVLALLIFIISPVMISRTPTDIFPSIDIPVVSVAWQYSGLNAEELEGRLTTSYEKALTALVEKRLETKDESPALTRPRHRHALNEALASLHQARNAQAPELFAEDLRLATRAIGRITGSVDVEEVLDSVFRDFCIGK